MKQPTREEITQKINMVLDGSITRESQKVYLITTNKPPSQETYLISTIIDYYTNFIGSYGLPSLSTA